MLASTILSISAALLAGIAHCAPSGYGPDALGPNGGITDLNSTVDNPNITYCGDKFAPAFETTGDPENGPGVWITNQDSDPNIKYFFVENSRDEAPWKYLTIAQGARVFVSVCETWQGHIIRGTVPVMTDGKSHNLGTWLESNVDLQGVMWGDVSFLEGCDGGARVAATDGSGVARQCLVDDLLSGAPEAALATKDTGGRILDKLVSGTANGAARDWELSKCSPNDVWIIPENSSPVISSQNGRFDITFYRGRI
ncbi:hypothetical protein F4778DRAFT_784169 [Xylariomycetidae sp. FL2044]|nr:hypothetical protein F4778DRAFT_784169 [Xylariomycetidae sp. FL2044]